MHYYEASVSPSPKSPLHVEHNEFAFAVVGEAVAPEDVAVVERGQVVDADLSRLQTVEERDWISDRRKAGHDFRFKKFHWSLLKKYASHAMCLLVSFVYF